MSSQRESNIYLRSLHLIERYANYLSKEARDKNNADILNELRPFVSHFCTALEYSNATSKIFKSYMAKVDSSSTELDCNQVLAEFDTEISEIDRDDLLSNCERYQELLQLTSLPSKQNDDDDDDDIVTVSQNINNIDPITKLPISEPVKNVKCGHTYEKSSILSLIKKNPKTKCPIPGCVATEWVEANDLVPDYAFKRMCTSKESVGTQKKTKVTDIDL